MQDYQDKCDDQSVMWSFAYKENRELASATKFRSISTPWGSRKREENKSILYLEGGQTSSQAPQGESTKLMIDRQF